MDLGHKRAGAQDAGRLHARDDDPQTDMYAKRDVVMNELYNEECGTHSNCALSEKMASYSHEIMKRAM